MAGIIIKASTITNGFECEYSEHLKRACKRAIEIVIGIVKKQRESYVSQ